MNIQTIKNINESITIAAKIITAKTIANIGIPLKRLSTPEPKFYQTQYARETIAIIEDSDGSISIGIARAGLTDIKNRRITPYGGMEVAEGRALKARELKGALIEKNYLRGIYAKKVTPIDPVGEVVIIAKEISITEKAQNEKENFKKFGIT